MLFALRKGPTAIESAAPVARNGRWFAATGATPPSVGIEVKADKSPGHRGEKHTKFDGKLGIVKIWSVSVNLSRVFGSSIA